MIKNVFSLPIILFILVILPPHIIKAQTTPPNPSPDDKLLPIPRMHVVVEGENLTYIANAYDVNVDELLQVNNLSETAVIFIGQQLIIPGGEWEAVATTYEVRAGDTLPEIAAMFQTTVGDIAYINKILNPYQSLPMETSLSVISRTGSAQPQPIIGKTHVVTKGETMLLIAARYGLTSLEVASANGLPVTTQLYRGQRLRIPVDGVYRNLPGEWVDVQVNPSPIRQGSTTAIYVENFLVGRPFGEFAGQPLLFVPKGKGYVALVGLNALAEVDLITLSVGGSGSQQWRPFEQKIPVQSSDFGTQEIEIGEELEMLLDPQIREEEDTFFTSVYGYFRETQQWEGTFQLPLTTTLTTTPYGVGRSYNDGPIDIYHSGIDFAAPEGTEISSPASGTVVFGGELDLRGSTIILDHGLGVMTGYYHLSESLVTEGDIVITGQPIAKVGSSGLSTGSHLHWDVRVMNVPVNGLQWVDEQFHKQLDEYDSP